MKKLNQTVQNFKESIFTTITELSNAHKAINLSQGFPDFDPPDWVLRIAQEKLFVGKNQYAPPRGSYALREALSKNYKKLYNLNYSAKEEILVTNGATEALFCSISALLNSGDEVILFEPCYDSYVATIKLSGAEIKVVTLNAPDFSFSVDELKSQITSKTKLLILNSPHNPTGKVFSIEELQLIAKLAIENDFYVISDEVYEYLTFDYKHIPIATLPGMQERVLTISSIGKTLSLTGWKIGWVAGPHELITTVLKHHQFVSYAVSHPIQEAIAEALQSFDEYLPIFKSEYQKRRDLLVDGLRQKGFDVFTPQGTYFALCKTAEGFNDFEFSKKLIVEMGVSTIPSSAFYLKSNEGSQFVRFCFAKRDETLTKALALLS